MSLSKVYPKNSFDRFGDDLSQYLLTFCCLLESLSKQFKKRFKGKETHNWQSTHHKMVGHRCDVQSVHRFEAFEEDSKEMLDSLHWIQG